MTTSVAQVQLAKKKKFGRQFRQDIPFFLMLLPGTLILLVNNYIPMIGAIMAFERYRFDTNLFVSLINSKWVGLKNFQFMIVSPDIFTATRNTILYNLAFIALGVIIPVAFAIAMNELWNQRMAKVYQSFIFLPYFLSWVIVAYLAFSILSINEGVINSMILKNFGMNIDFYQKPQFWPFIIIFFQVWKYTGYNTVVYLASLSGISNEYYEAASLDGATKWQQIKYITIPMLKTIIIIVTLLAVGRIFNSDFGLFYNVPMSRGALYTTTNVIDTLVYRSLTNSANISMASAAGLYQSVVGCLTVFIANAVVRKVDNESSLF